MSYDNPNPSTEETTDVVAHALVAVRKRNNDPSCAVDVVNEEQFAKSCIRLYMGANTPSRRNTIYRKLMSPFDVLYGAILTRATEIEIADARAADGA